MRLGQIAVGILSFSRDKEKKYEFHVGAYEQAGAPSTEEDEFKSRKSDRLTEVRTGSSPVAHINKNEKEIKYE